MKTYFRRLEGAVRAGDAERADAEHRLLSTRIDRAVARGGLHRRAGARRKAQAARVRASLGT